MALMYRRRLVAEDDAASSRLLRLTSLYDRLTRLIVEHHRKVVWMVALFPLLFVMLMVIGKLFTPRLYRYAIAEDSVVEYATFLIYLLAALVAMTLAIDLRRQCERMYFVSYGLLAAGLFAVGMEEISWGQRIFNIETPSFLETRNTKGELNLHNVGGFPLHNAFIIVGFYGAFARRLVPGPVTRRHPKLVDLFTPPYRLFLYFFLPGTLYLHYQYLYYRYLLPLDLDWTEFYREFYAESFVTGKDQEPIELLLALGFLLFVVINRDRYYRG